jgi:hypothetical protein
MSIAASGTRREEIAMSDQKTVERELLELEEQFWNAMKTRDSATAVALSDDACIVVGAQGVGEVDRATLAHMLESANYEIEAFAIEDVHVRRVTEDVATVAYKVREDLVVDGEKLKLEAFDASVWLRRAGAWVCVLHTESPAGDPFGRQVQPRTGAAAA